MKNLQNYESCTKPELLEMLEEAKRAQKILSKHEEDTIHTETKFHIGEAEVMTVISDMNTVFVLDELERMIDVLETQLAKFN